MAHQVPHMESITITEPYGEIDCRIIANKRQQPYAYIETLTVYTEYLRQGYGTILINQLTEELYNIGINCMKLAAVPCTDIIDADSLFRFYELNGFEHTHDNMYQRII